MASTLPFKKRFGKSKWSGLFLILFIVGLYIFQSQAVMPFVESVVESDAFEADTSALGGKDRSELALGQCHEFVKQDLGAERTLQFGDNDFKNWVLGDGRYLISSHVIDVDGSGKQVRRNYACNIQYNGGDDSQPGSWSLNGLEIRDR